MSTPKKPIYPNATHERMRIIRKVWDWLLASGPQSQAAVLEKFAQVSKSKAPKTIRQYLETLETAGYTNRKTVAHPQATPEGVEAGKFSVTDFGGLAHPQPLENYIRAKRWSKPPLPLGEEPTT